MKKSVLQKKIAALLVPHGFSKLKDGVYSFDCGDGTTRLLLRLPDLTRGFILAAQFRDFEPFNDNFSDAVMKQFDYENTLAFASKREYSDEAIEKAVSDVLSGISDYLERGKAAIRDNIEEWLFGAFDEGLRNRVFQYMGFPGVDPYSHEYLLEQVSEHQRRRGGMVSVLSLDEYRQHKDFYDQYEQYHCELEIDEKNQVVRIRYKF